MKKIIIIIIMLYIYFFCLLFMNIFDFYSIQFNIVRSYTISVNKKGAKTIRFLGVMVPGNEQVLKKNYTYLGANTLMSNISRVIVSVCIIIFIVIIIISYYCVVSTVGPCDGRSRPIMSALLIF